MILAVFATEPLGPEQIPLNPLPPLQKNPFPPAGGEKRDQSQDSWSIIKEAVHQASCALINISWMNGPSDEVVCQPVGQITFDGTRG